MKASLLLGALCLLGLSAPPARAIDIPEDDFAWVNLRAAIPSLGIDLRYGSSRNLAGRALYPTGMQPWLRAGVARRLFNAQTLLQRMRFGLRIWDAYRPKEAQAQLWRLAPNSDYVANPAQGSGSMHTWGVAVDATLVDEWMRPVVMPTEFDDFSPAAMLRYTGSDPLVRSHLYLLQRAMGRSGFYGLRTEWWHFTTADWDRYVSGAPIQAEFSPPEP